MERELTHNTREVCDILMNRRIPFHVHYPSGRESDHAVVTVDNTLNNDELQIVASLGFSHSPQNKFQHLGSVDE